MKTRLAQEAVAQMSDNDYCRYLKACQWSVTDASKYMVNMVVKTLPNLLKSHSLDLGERE